MFSMTNKKKQKTAEVATACCSVKQLSIFPYFQENKDDSSHRFKLENIGILFPLKVLQHSARASLLKKNSGTLKWD